MRLPSDVEVPLFVKDEFANFYRAMFAQQVKKEDMRAVFLEYAWDMGWCDPCAADPLSREELRELGVFWTETMGGRRRSTIRRGRRTSSSPASTCATTASTFPEDLVFQETGDRANFQGRYVLRHPWTGKAAATRRDAYRRELPERYEQEAQNLASLTGWDIAEDPRPDEPEGEQQPPGRGRRALVEGDLEGLREGAGGLSSLPSRAPAPAPAASRPGPQ